MFINIAVMHVVGPSYIVTKSVRMINGTCTKSLTTKKGREYGEKGRAKAAM